MGPSLPKVVLARRTRCAYLKWPPLRSVLLGILTDHGASGVLSLAVVDDAEMEKLHRRFLCEDGPTDVLSFALGEERKGGAGRKDPPGGGPPPGARVFGEVVVSAETAVREAARRRVPPERELSLYAVHGTLHLVGFDDGTEADRREMRRMERKYLRDWSAGGGSRSERLRREEAARPEARQALGRWPARHRFPRAQGR